MPTITVSAADSATAMDQILSQLGDDALILDTKTRDGKVEISATNDLGYTPKKKDKISDVFTKVMQEELHSHQGSRQYSNPITGRPSMDKATSDAFMKAIAEEQPEQAQADGSFEEEAQINIRVKRLKWENEKLAKDIEDQRNEIRNSAETAKVFYEKAIEQGEETKQQMNLFSHDLNGLRATVNQMRGDMVSRRKHRLSMVVLIMALGLTAGTYTMRDHLSVLTPYVSGLLETMGIMPAATPEQIEISALDATRMGDTIRIKGTVTNHNQSQIEAPMIRFQVKDKTGGILGERDVRLDQDSLMPSVGVTVTTQLVMHSSIADDIETDIIAIPIFETATNDA